MILVADSGSTKTTWAQVGTGQRLTTQGLNPLFCSDTMLNEVAMEVRHFFHPNLNDTRIYFYGAGCGQDRQKDRVRQALMTVMATAEVEVATDMLGACRAVCGQKEGVVGILGTGSNCCCYDGKAIIFQPFSTGYILGDHGSANHVGRRLLNDYLSGQMPSDLVPLFHEAFPLTYEQHLDAVYRQPNANRYLASFAPFALHNSLHHYCFNVVLDSLNEWWRYQLSPCLEHSQSNAFSIIGSYGAVILSPMTHFLKEHNLHLQKAVANPIDGLLTYHADML